MSGDSEYCHILIAATTEPPKFGRALDAPERLAGVERAAARDADELLGLLKGEVEAAAQVIRHMSGMQRGKIGIHVRQGAMTVADVVEVLIVGHAEDHLRQVQATLQTR